MNDGIHDGYVKIAETKDIPLNTMQVFQAKTQEILVVHAEGEFYAFENKCPHMGYPLYLGSLKGKVITCGFHYARFDVKTGKSLGMVTHKPLRIFRVRMRKTSILVEFNTNG